MNVLDAIPEKDRDRLAALLKEAQQRGLLQDVKEKVSPAAKRNLKWPIGENGYFANWEDGRTYNPKGDQEPFVQTKAFFSSFVGSRGCGKTTSGAQKALLKIKSGQRGIVMNPDFENLKISTWPEFRVWIPWGMVTPSQRYMADAKWSPHQPFNLNFLNGALVYVKGVKDPDSARGPNVNWLWYDEGQRDRDGLSWQTAVASVRIGKDPQAWLTGTPRGKRHWMYKFFEKNEISEEIFKMFDSVGGGRPLIESFHGTIYQNQDNLNPGFMAAMLAAYPSGWLRKQEIEGKYVDEGGTLGDRTWFNGRVLKGIPENTTIQRRVRFWDLAATEKKLIGVRGKKLNDPDETVGTLVSWDGEYFYIENQRCGFLEWDDILDLITKTAIEDGPYTDIFVEQEPASGGKNQVAAVAKHIREKLPGHPTVKPQNPKNIGDKVVRANHWFSKAKEGRIFVIDGEWVEPFFDELDDFGLGGHDDKIDSVSGAIHEIAPIVKWVNIPFMALTSTGVKQNSSV